MPRRLVLRRFWYLQEFSLGKIALYFCEKPIHPNSVFSKFLRTERFLRTKKLQQADLILAILAWASIKLALTPTLNFHRINLLIPKWPEVSSYTHQKSGEKFARQKSYQFFLETQQKSNSKTNSNFRQKLCRVLDRNARKFFLETV